MANNPAVSVIVPIYNVELYVKQCVDSILNQTFQDFEIILVDDASPDKSFELCQKLYGDNEKIRFIRHEKNLGLGPARNTGMKNARGKYIYFVDSDDFILPETLETFFDVAEKNDTQVVHAAGWYELTQDEPEPIRPENLTMELDEYKQEGFLPFDVPYRLEEYWRKRCIQPMVWLCFCRRDFLEQNCIKFLPIISEDDPFSIALHCLAERYYVLYDAFYVYRKRAGSTMRTKNVEQILKSIRSIMIDLNYVKNFLDTIPYTNDYEQWRENVINESFLRFIKWQTLPHYKELTVSPEINKATEKIFSEFFGDNSIFVKYFFNNYHLCLYQSAILAQNRNNISQNLTDLFDRAEIYPRKIVFVNFIGRGYGCNPKYIAEEIIKQNLPYDLVWLVKDLNEPMPAKIRKVLYKSLDSIYELATAKVIVTNTKNLLPYSRKKQGQYFIMTWHDSGPFFKKVEQEAEDKLPHSYIKASKFNSEITDLMLTGTQSSFDAMRQSFWYRGEILKCGSPRNDIFFNHDAELIQRIRKTLNVPAGNKVIMYAPTFRDNPAIFDTVYNFDAKKLLQGLEKKFGGKWTLLMRFHPNIAETDFAKKFFASSENVINATNYPDMQELIVASDVLISDYSSVIYDFMLCGKPVFIFAKDFYTYPEERGFKQIYFHLPYKVNLTAEELFDCIENFDAKDLEPAIKSFMDEIKPFDTGHASEAVVARIKEVIGKLSPPI